jgi:alpha-glucoside transport system substrate-binding protein
MMPGGYLEEALYGAYAGTVTVDGSPFSDCDKQRFFESMAAFEEATGIQVNYIGDREFEARPPVAIEACAPPDIVDFPLPGKAEDNAREGHIIDPTTWISDDWFRST